MPHGKWILVRSDRLTVTIDRLNYPVVVGRSSQLPAQQQIGGKYVSREQFSATWSEQGLEVSQLGKNPTFCGTDCIRVPTTGVGSLLFCAGSDAAVAPRAASDGTDTVVTVPPLDPLQVVATPTVGCKDEATLHFPVEVGLPTFVVRYQKPPGPRVGDSAATMNLSTAEMLSVPVVGVADADEEEENNGSVGGQSEWQGLLDAVIQQKQSTVRQLPPPTAASSTAAVPSPSSTGPKTAAAGGGGRRYRFPLERH